LLRRLEIGEPTLSEIREIFTSEMEDGFVDLVHGKELMARIDETPDETTTNSQ